jgi:putative hydrolase of the HAD superfamily
MTKTSLLLLDLDDTLCDYAGARHHRLRHAFGMAFAEIGATDAMLEALIAESIAIQPHGADHFGELLRRYGVHDGRAIAVARDWYQSNRFHGLSLFAGAVEMLDRWRAADSARRIGLITNGPAEVQRAKIELLALSAHVDFALVSGEFGVAKPDPAIFQEALRLGGADAGEAVMAGDSPEFDIAGARSLQIPAIWINRGEIDWPGPGSRPDYQARSLLEIETLLAAGLSSHNPGHVPAPTPRQHRDSLL